ncbi:hypothetical protein SERLA73DRAFT_54118 [Serpula lacrymans var. lacrymans S7.3]|uniref:Uncharacterized protein n=1 Tax=Serpula lacrymans var. lacrymans (strain S7.3) TaxID=936435 RepID=F8PWV5_SERL3|nr:hypothetical protein SERLA73DRAFT_54118 [Serpula lacrymans var. lacrymans S7.3]
MSPPRKPQSPPQLLIPDSASPSSRHLFPHSDPPIINAPDGDGGFVNSGPQLHIVPATPVSGGGATSHTVPFQNTLDTLHHGMSLVYLTAALADLPSQPPSPHNSRPRPGITHPPIQPHHSPSPYSNNHNTVKHISPYLISVNPPNSHPPMHSFLIPCPNTATATIWGCPPLPLKYHSNSPSPQITSPPKTILLITTPVSLRTSTSSPSPLLATDQRATPPLVPPLGTCLTTSSP